MELDLRGSKAYADRAFRWSAAAAAGLVLLILGLIALTITGRVLRYVFGVLAVAIGASLLALTWPVVTELPVTAVASTVTEATGLSGTNAVAALVAEITALLQVVEPIARDALARLEKQGGDVPVDDLME
jgi:hypothetical protein